MISLTLLTPMAKTRIKKPQAYTETLYMNGLRGRMLRLPAPPKKTREILLVYGHHASIERMFGIAEDLNQYGGVTLPDLPGFGGMQSFYSIKEKPTLDNLADYLAAFVKLRYKRKKVTIIGMSFGFVVVARMLQKYPELLPKVNMLVSIVGFAHHEDFKIKRHVFLMLKTGARICSSRLMSGFVRHVVLRPLFIKAAYKMVADKHSKFKDASQAERDRRIDFEIGLWHSNDVRTYMYTTVIMMSLDICNQRVDIPIYHVSVEHDRYFDNHIVEQHLKIIFPKVYLVKSKMPNHAPTVVADAKMAAPFIPTKLRKLLASVPSA